MTLHQAIQHGTRRLQALPTARRDAELLLMRAANCDRTQLLTHPEAPFTPDQLEAYEAWLERRAQHEPIQYILGEQEFYGLNLRVTPDVLIPRPETEHLVEAALARLPHDIPVRIADVGTGSGAIAIALANALPLSLVLALDLSPAALAIAQSNAEHHQLASRIRFIASDLLQAIDSESFDAIVSNPPYVPSEEVLEPQVHNYEPHTALFAGPDGLNIYRRLIPQAFATLKPNGWLLMEIGHGQQDSLQQLLQEWKNVSFVNDLQGIPRVTCARRP